MIEKFLAAWCRHMHDSLMWPAHGAYTCSKCFRRHPVPWEVRQPIVMPVRTPRPVAAPSASMDVCA